MTSHGDNDHTARPTKSRILAALYFLIDSCREIGERPLAEDLEAVVRDHDGVERRQGALTHGVKKVSKKRSMSSRQLGDSNG